jgi:N-acetyl-1-D-myo-inositol-2-amino-2-deoxy-alpha-D-glucopyranoside deacetylase
MSRNTVQDIRSGDRWVVVVAHPDDETFGCGSLIAYAARRGAHVTVICATCGEAGERTPEIAEDADLGEVRTAELFEAARLLGAADVELLHYADSGFEGDLPARSLCAAPLVELTAWLVARLQELAADVVVVIDGSDGHRDHLHVRAAAEQAITVLAGATLLLVGLPNHLMRRWLDEMRSVDPDSPYQTIDAALLGTPDDLVTDVIEHPELLSVRDEAIAAHRSQRSPFEDLSPDLRRSFLASTHLIRPGETIGGGSAPSH